MMREKFDLNQKEEVQRKILFILLVSIFLIVIKGIYNQSNNINQDKVLTPAFLIASFSFCIIYSFNAFTTGNLVRNWSSYRIYNAIYNFLKNKKRMGDKEALRTTTKVFGFFTLGLAIVCIIVGIYELNNGF